MNKRKRNRLKTSGWAVGDAKDFLGLSKEEAVFVELKLALAEGLQRSRESHQLTQAELAQRLGSSQSRVAKMEASDPSVSLDLLVRSLLASGATRSELARIIGNSKSRRTAIRVI